MKNLPIGIQTFEGLIKVSFANLMYQNDKSVCEDMYRNVQ